MNPMAINKAVFLSPGVLRAIYMNIRGISTVPTCVKISKKEAVVKSVGELMGINKMISAPAITISVKIPLNLKLNTFRSTI